MYGVVVAHRMALHMSSVNAKHELGAGFNGFQRPESKHCTPDTALCGHWVASRECEQRTEEVAPSFLGAIDVPLIKDWS